MKIAVIGAGGIGGYFGGRLAAAGHDVSFVAGGAHLGARTGTATPVNALLYEVLSLREARTGATGP
ncbi:2-dehydropantoate 2-reductase N-terminal domain-containing protein [Streptosporangium sp. NPDC003464]